LPRKGRDRIWAGTTNQQEWTRIVELHREHRERTTEDAEKLFTEGNEGNEGDAMIPRKEVSRFDAVFVREVKAAFVSFQAELNDGNDDLELFSEQWAAGAGSCSNARKLSWAGSIGI
jgi:hypothetical protein